MRWVFSIFAFIVSLLPIALLFSGVGMLLAHGVYGWDYGAYSGEAFVFGMVLLFILTSGASIVLWSFAIDAKTADRQKVGRP